MNSELLRWTDHIIDRFGKSWSLSWEDLRKPDADEVLQTLIASAPPEYQARLTEEFFDCGPLTMLLPDRAFSEIIVNGPKEIWLESQGRFQRFQDIFLSEVTFKRFTDRVCAEAGMKVDLAFPFANGRWRDFRCHLTMAPLTHCSTHLALRRSMQNHWTLELLEQSGWAAPQEVQVIRQLISSRQNVLVIGPTGSGKTSVLGAMLKALPENERVLVLEDTDELPRPNAASTKLLARPGFEAGLSEITLNDLVKQSLRMRPERLVVGEVRGAEAKDLMLALATGHSGSMGTLHASDPRQALLRLEMLIQMGSPQWSLDSIRQLLHLSLNALIVCGNENGHRRLAGVYRVAALEPFGLLIESML